MSAVFTTAASLLIYAIVVRQLAEAPARYRILAGLAAGICFGLSPLVWSQAVITEVYALQALLVVLLIFLYTLPVAQKPLQERALDAGRGLVLGLALANHMTALLLVPLLLLAGTIKHRETDALPSSGRRWLRSARFDLPALGLQLLGLAVGASLYLTLPLRAGAHPPVSWGNPLDGQGLWWLVSGKLYLDYYKSPSLSWFLEQARAWAQFAVVQLGLSGIFLGLLGLVVFGRLSRLLLLTAGLAVAALAFSFVYHPADADVYLMPLLISFSIWLGLGVGGLAELLSRRSPALAVG